MLVENSCKRSAFSSKPGRGEGIRKEADIGHCTIETGQSAIMCVVRPQGGGTMMAMQTLRILLRIGHGNVLTQGRAQQEDLQAEWSGTCRIVPMSATPALARRHLVALTSRHPFRHLRKVSERVALYISHSTAHLQVRMLTATCLFQLAVVTASVQLLEPHATSCWKIRPRLLEVQGHTATSQLPSPPLNPHPAARLRVSDSRLSSNPQWPPHLRAEGHPEAALRRRTSRNFKAPRTGVTPRL